MIGLLLAWVSDHITAEEYILRGVLCLTLGQSRRRLRLYLSSCTGNLTDRVTTFFLHELDILMVSQTLAPLRHWVKNLE